ncbi:hypothetical protein PG984_007045 [Apiospora sp. TS-2023a]
MEELRKASTKVVLAHDGDLTVVILHTTEIRKSKELIVDSHTLERSSSGFQALVSTKQHDVVLLSGNPKHYELLFSIIHGRYGALSEDVSDEIDSLFGGVSERHEALPKDISEDDLLGLALVAEKYQVAHLVGPLVTAMSPDPCKWLKWIGEKRIRSVLVRVQKRLWVAWVFGESSLFRHLALLLVQRVTLSKDNELLMGGVSLSGICKTNNVPEVPGLFDLITKEYNNRHQDICNFMVSVTSINADTWCLLKSRPDPERCMCDAIIVGSIVRGYQGYIPDASRRCMAIGNLQTLFDRLSGITINNYPTIPSDGLPDRKGRTHDFCNPSYWMKQQLAFRFKRYLDLDEDMKKHLSRQAQRTGVKEPKIDTGLECGLNVSDILIYKDPARSGDWITMDEADHRRIMYRHRRRENRREAREAGRPWWEIHEMESEEESEEPNSDDDKVQISSEDEKIEDATYEGNKTTQETMKEKDDLSDAEGEVPSDDEI